LKHFTTIRFWHCYQQLPATVRGLADKNFLLLQQIPSTRRCNSKRSEKFGPPESIRHYRAIAAETDEGFIWFWIGSHANYDKLFS
jgi:hypothetical protein